MLKLVYQDRIMMKKVNRIGRRKQMKNQFQESVVQSILNVLSFTEKDLGEDYQKSISKSSRNGLTQAVWARRSDMLDEEFGDTENIEVLHVPRTKIWQIDPVFDQTSGNLYLLFSTRNLLAVKNRFQKHGKYTHYAVSLLLLNKEMSPLDGEQLELLPISEKDNQKVVEKREADIKRIVGGRGERISQVVIVHADYHNGEAISAEVAKFNDLFELCEVLDVSDMLEYGYETPSDEKQLVKLKNPDSPENPTKVKRIVRLKEDTEKQKKNKG